VLFVEVVLFQEVETLQLGVGFGEREDGGAIESKRF